MRGTLRKAEMYIFLISSSIILVWTLLALKSLFDWNFSTLKTLQKLSIYTFHIINRLTVKKVETTKIKDISPNLRAKDPLKTDTKECPFCYEIIKIYASRCPFCGESLGKYLSFPLSHRPKWIDSLIKRYYIERARISYLDLPLSIVEWLLESIVQNFKKLAIFEILDYASRISVIVGVVFWIIAINERKIQDRAQSWQLILLGEQIGSSSTIQILEALNCTDLWFCTKASFQGISLHNLNLHDLKLPKATLQEVTLSEVILHKANLQGADLSRAVLNDTSFVSADLSNADLTGSQLIRANLNNTNLSSADLSNANLTNANLSGANLQNANLSEANLQNADLSGANLQNADLVGTDLQGADLKDTDLRDVIYNDVPLSFSQNDILSPTKWPLGFDPKNVQLPSSIR